MSIDSLDDRRFEQRCGLVIESKDLSPSDSTDNDKTTT